jgi:excisionase family DNA binding protein
VNLGRSGCGTTGSGATGEDVVALAANPGRIAELPPETARALLAETAALIVQLGALQPLLLARLGGTAVPTAASGAALTVAEAAARLKVSPDWLYRHQRQLPFVRHVGRRSLRCDAASLARWLATRPRA